MYQEKIDAAIALLQEHNNAIGTSLVPKTPDPDVIVQNPGWIFIEQSLARIKAAGGTNEDRLKSFSYEDILQNLVVEQGYDTISSNTGTGYSKDRIWPTAIAKALAQIFRGKETPVNRPISKVKADRMLPRELVEAFDPEDTTSPIAQRLIEITKSQKFIVYESGRIVDVETTLKLLTELKQGYPARNDIDVSGKIKRVYNIGELPSNYADENPLYVGRPLRPDGTCDQTGRSWEGVPMEVRQLVRLAIFTKELTVSIERAHQILDTAVQPEAMESLRKHYRKASILFDEKPDDRPKLKIELGTATGKGPFSDGHPVFKTDGHPVFQNGKWVK